MLAYYKTARHIIGALDHDSACDIARSLGDMATPSWLPDGPPTGCEWRAWGLAECYSSIPVSEEPYYERPERLTIPAGRGGEAWQFSTSALTDDQTATLIRLVMSRDFGWAIVPMSGDLMSRRGPLSLPWVDRGGLVNVTTISRDGTSTTSQARQPLLA